jgi:hypothetical protein
MSGHTDDALSVRERNWLGDQGQAQIERKHDALVAENQQLREALTALVHWWDLGDGDPDDQFETARAALAGTPSEDT